MKKLFIIPMAIFMMSFQSLSADGYIASYSIKVSDVPAFAKLTHKTMYFLYIYCILLLRFLISEKQWKNYLQLL